MKKNKKIKSLNLERKNGSGSYWHENEKTIMNGQSFWKIFKTIEIETFKNGRRNGIKIEIRSK